MEEQHGSMAIIHKYHPDLSKENLCLRSYLHSLRFLCMSEDNVLARRTQAAVERLQKKTPAKARALHMFVSDAVSATKRQLGPAAKLSFEGAQRVVSGAASAFTELPPEARRSYAVVAEARQAKRQRAIDAEVAFLRNQHTQIEECRAQGVAGLGIQHRLAQLRFSDADLGPARGGLE